MSAQRYNLALIATAFAVLATMRSAEAAYLLPSDATWADEFAVSSDTADLSQQQSVAADQAWQDASQRLRFPQLEQENSLAGGNHTGNFGTVTIDHSVNSGANAYLTATDQTLAELVQFLSRQRSRPHSLYARSGPFRPPQVA